MTNADAIQLALNALLSCRLEGDGWSGPLMIYDEVKVQEAIKALNKRLGEDATDG